MLTDTQKEIIKNLYLSGLNCREISEKFNLKRSSVNRVIQLAGIARNARESQLKYHFNEKIFDCIDSEEKAYWLGFLYADGYVETVDKKHHLVLALAKKDRQHIERFNNFLQSNYPIHDYIIKTGEFSGKEYSKVMLNSPHLVETLISYGCTPRKSLTLKFPDFNIFKSQSLINHFIRGYFDGDGSVFISNEKHWRNGTMTKVIHYRFVGTEEFLQQIDFQINLKGCKKKKKRSQAWELAYKRKKKVLPFFKYLYEDATVYLDRKRDIFINYIKEECSETIISQLNVILKLKG